MNKHSFELKVLLFSYQRGIGAKGERGRAHKPRHVTSHEFHSSMRLINDETRPVRTHHMFVRSAAPD